MTCLTKLMVAIALIGVGAATMFGFGVRSVEQSLRRGEIGTDGLWESAELVAGPVPAFADLLHGTPGLGISGTPYSQITTQRVYARGLRILYPEIPEASILVAPHHWQQEIQFLCAETSQTVSEIRSRSGPTSALSREDASTLARAERLQEILGVPEDACAYFPQNYTQHTTPPDGAQRRR